MDYFRFRDADGVPYDYHQIRDEYGYPLYWCVQTGDVVKLDVDKPSGEVFIRKVGTAKSPDSRIRTTESEKRKKRQKEKKMKEMDMNKKPIHVVKYKNNFRFRFAIEELLNTMNINHLFVISVDGGIVSLNISAAKLMIILGVADGSNSDLNLIKPDAELSDHQKRILDLYPLRLPDLCVDCEDETSPEEVVKKIKSMIN